MNTEIDTKPATNHLREAAKEISERAAHTAKDVTGAVEHMAKDVGNATKEFYHTAALKAEDGFEASKECMRRNPVPIVLGAIAFGAALGYLMVMSRRKPTFVERYAEEPFHAVREAFLGAIAPVTHRVHKGYDSARDGAERSVHSFSDQVGRVGSNLKFW